MDIEELEKCSQTHDDSTLLQYLIHKFNTISNINELTPDILHRFIRKIEIIADGKSKVYYRTSAPNCFLFNSFY
ncbi:hypothetical protein CN586_08435 [Bacillus toyonensis]|uniref:DUF4368 domain-containing protein n=1 Tax=Bacillus toyonensis TaxID=155322 RepID=UPI000BF092A1|nr:hypothetical protein CN586_08435 [Bacillus toyonensis]